MKFFNYTKPKMIVADEGYGLRDKNDVYVPEHYDIDGNLIPEYFPHYSTTIFVPDTYTEEMAKNQYVEE